MHYYDKLFIAISAYVDGFMAIFQPHTGIRYGRNRSILGGPVQWAATEGMTAMATPMIRRIKGLPTESGSAHPAESH